MRIEITSFPSAIWIAKHSMEPTINSFLRRIVGSNNAQVVEQFNDLLRSVTQVLTVIL